MHRLTGISLIAALCVATAPVVQGATLVTKAWQRTFSTAMNSNIYDARGIKVDNDGNVYVTVIGAPGPNYYLLKYDPAGELLWETHYPYPEGGAYPYDMALDRDGCVYITGFQVADGRHYLTVKYDSAGDLIWEAQYPGLYAYQIEVDTLGGVFVRGTADVVCYDTDGNLRWERVFRGPPGGAGQTGAIVPDNDGGVFVTGRAGGTSGTTDCVTARYDEFGGVSWVRSYDTPIGHSDHAFACVLDSSGDLIVAGGASVASQEYGFLTAKYSRDGILLWDDVFTTASPGDDFATTVAIGPDGIVYVGGFFALESASDRPTGIVAYDAGGTRLWSHLLPGGGIVFSTAMPRLVVDASGNGVITGGVAISPYPYQYLTAAFTPNGERTWMRIEQIQHIPPVTYPYSYTTAICADETGCIYVTGHSAAENPSGDALTIKYVPVECDDQDGDLTCDFEDDCPGVSDTFQFDLDLDGIGDLCDGCTDPDGDGLSSPDFAASNCPLDNCPWDFNPSQLDRDQDGSGDACDRCTDADGDGYAEPPLTQYTSCGIDRCPDLWNTDQTDLDGDGWGFECDCNDTDPSFYPIPWFADLDGDGLGDPGDSTMSCFELADHVLNSTDNCPLVFNPDQQDADGDGYGDVCDPCSCPCLADPLCDSITNVIDVVKAVGVAFDGDSSGVDVSCPYEQCDANCDGLVNVIDVVRLVNVAFRGQDAAVQFCDPCAP